MPKKVPNVENKRPRRLRFLGLALAILTVAAAAGQTPAPAHKVVLNWAASADAATEALTYSVYRATGACSGSVAPAALSGASLLTATTYTDTAVSGGTSYCYDVVAVSATGAVSAPSNEVTAAVPLAAPSALSVAVE